MIVPLMGYAPDADSSILGVLTNCSGVIPTTKGLKGAPTPATTPLAALASTCQGSVVVTKLDGTTRFFAGMSSQINEAGVSTWSNVSTTTYGTANTSRWRFAQQGNVTLAVNGANTMSASTGSNFTVLPSAPVAALVEVVNQFVLVANTLASQQTWQCSALGDYTSWANSIATQAVSGTLTSSPGPITGLRRFGDSVIAFKKNSMYFGTYVGAPTVWNFIQIPGEAGAMSQEAIVNIGTPENPKLIFMGNEDFYVFDGSRPVPIGTNRLKVKVFGELLQSRYYACTALHDKVKSLVYFYYPVADSIFPDHCAVYNYRTDRWGLDDRQIEATTEYVSGSVTYDTLGGSYATYDALPSIPYDLAFLNASQAQPAIFSTDHKPYTLTGAAASTSITTGDYGDDDRFITVRRIRPRFLTAPTSASLTNYYRNSIGDSLTTDSASALISGKFDFLRDARWHRFKMDMVGDWEMSGFSYDAEDSGDE